MSRLLILGAGEAGQIVFREIQSSADLKRSLEVVGFIDDVVKGELLGVPVFGPIADAKAIIARERADQVIVAIPSADRDVMDRIVRALEGSRVQVKIVPGLSEIIKGTVEFKQIRAIEYSDLLGREEVDFEDTELHDAFRDKTILITGAGGSIGSELVRQLLILPVKAVVGFGHGENSMFLLQREVGSDARFSFVIGDIRDPEKLKREMLRVRPDMVFHSAAHKHVDLMEEFPDEAVKNNVLGTANVAKAAVEAGVGRFVLISTDKAVRPTSMMGMTKRLAEKIVLSMGGFQPRTRFSLVRFGNVLGSRGSVTHTFIDQILRGGPITVRDPEVTRYFMSIREASRLVLQSITAGDGSVFVLEMGRPIKIVDLARKMRALYAPPGIEIPIVFTGLNPGEKKHEILTERDEDLRPTGRPKILKSVEPAPLFADAAACDRFLDETKDRASTRYRRDDLRAFLAEALR